MAPHSNGSAMIFFCSQVLINKCNRQDHNEHYRETHYEFFPNVLRYRDRNGKQQGTSVRFNAENDIIVINLEVCELYTIISDL